MTDEQREKAQQYLDNLIRENDERIARFLEDSRKDALAESARIAGLLDGDPEYHQWLDDYHTEGIELIRGIAEVFRAEEHEGCTPDHPFGQCAICGGGK